MAIKNELRKYELIADLSVEADRQDLDGTDRYVIKTPIPYGLLAAEPSDNIEDWTLSFEGGVKGSPAGVDYTDGVLTLYLSDSQAVIHERDPNSTRWAIRTNTARAPVVDAVDLSAGVTREGEAGFSTIDALDIFYDKQVKFNADTVAEIKKALENIKDIDRRLPEYEEFKGDYDSAVTYKAGEMVYAHEHIYLALQETTGNEPEVNADTAYWHILSSVSYKEATQAEIQSGNVNSRLIGTSALRAGIKAFLESLVKWVSTAMLKDNAVTTDKLDDRAVEENKIDPGAVSRFKIKEGTITHDRIADNTIISAKIAPNTIEGNRIKGEAISHSKLAEGAVHDDNIFDNAVVTRTINNNAVTAGKLAPAVPTEHKFLAVKDGALVWEDPGDHSSVGVPDTSALQTKVNNNERLLRNFLANIDEYSELTTYRQNAVVRDADDNKYYIHAFAGSTSDKPPSLRHVANLADANANNPWFEISYEVIAKLAVDTKGTADRASTEATTNAKHIGALFHDRPKYVAGTSYNKGKVLFNASESKLYVYLHDSPQDVNPATNHVDDPDDVTAANPWFEISYLDLVAKYPDIGTGGSGGGGGTGVAPWNRITTYNFGEIVSSNGGLWFWDETQPGNTVNGPGEFVQNSWRPIISFDTENVITVPPNQAAANILPYRYYTDGTSLLLFSIRSRQAPIKLSDGIQQGFFVDLSPTQLQNYIPVAGNFPSPSNYPNKAVGMLFRKELRDSNTAELQSLEIRQLRGNQNLTKEIRIDKTFSGGSGASLSNDDTYESVGVRAGADGFGTCSEPRLEFFVDKPWVANDANPVTEESLYVGINDTNYGNIFPSALFSSARIILKLVDREGNETDFQIVTVLENLTGGGSQQVHSGDYAIFRVNTVPEDIDTVKELLRTHSGRVNISYLTASQTTKHVFKELQDLSHNQWRILHKFPGDRGNIVVKEHENFPDESTLTVANEGETYIQERIEPDGSPRFDRQKIVVKDEDKIVKVEKDFFGPLSFETGSDTTGTNTHYYGYYKNEALDLGSIANPSAEGQYIFMSDIQVAGTEVDTVFVYVKKSKDFPIATALDAKLVLTREGIATPFELDLEVDFASLVGSPFLIYSKTLATAALQTQLKTLLTPATGENANNTIHARLIKVEGDTDYDMFTVSTHETDEFVEGAGYKLKDINQEQISVNKPLPEVLEDIDVARIYAQAPRKQDLSIDRSKAKLELVVQNSRRKKVYDEHYIEDDVHVRSGYDEVTTSAGATETTDYYRGYKPVGVKAQGAPKASSFGAIPDVHDHDIFAFTKGNAAGYNRTTDEAYIGLPYRLNNAATAILGDSPATVATLEADHTAAALNGVVLDLRRAADVDELASYYTASSTATAGTKVTTEIPKQFIVGEDVDQDLTRNYRYYLMTTNNNLYNKVKDIIGSGVSTENATRNFYLRFYDEDGNVLTGFNGFVEDVVTPESTIEIPLQGIKTVDKIPEAKDTKHGFEYREAVLNTENKIVGFIKKIAYKAIKILEKVKTVYLNAFVKVTVTSGWQVLNRPNFVVYAFGGTNIINPADASLGGGAAPTPQVDGDSATDIAYFQTEGGSYRWAGLLLTSEGMTKLGVSETEKANIRNASDGRLLSGNTVSNAANKTLEGRVLNADGTVDTELTSVPLRLANQGNSSYLGYSYYVAPNTTPLTSFPGPTHSFWFSGNVARMLKACGVQDEIYFLGYDLGPMVFSSSPRVRLMGAASDKMYNSGLDGTPAFPTGKKIEFTIEENGVPLFGTSQQVTEKEPVEVNELVGVSPIETLVEREVVSSSSHARAMPNGFGSSTGLYKIPLTSQHLETLKGLSDSDELIVEVSGRTSASDTEAVTLTKTFTMASLRQLEDDRANNRQMSTMGGLIFDFAGAQYYQAFAVFLFYGKVTTTSSISSAIETENSLSVSFGGASSSERANTWFTIRIRRN